MTDSILPLIQSKHKLFLSGPFGSGKTTLAVERIRWLLRQERVRGDDILVLTPQRTVAEPYYQALRNPQLPSGTPVRVTTLAGLARQAVELYWPLLATVAGFADPAREPTFLNLETSQYHMARFVDDAIARGEFDGIRIEHNRVVSQVLDNLNKAALQGFTIDEAYTRLELAVPSGDQRTAGLNALLAARNISQAFRQLCLEETLLDFSLQIELFMRHVLVHDWSRTHLFRSHRHLIFDNLEEDTLSAHQLVQQWLPHLESALLLADTDAGFRLFLGADPEGVTNLAAQCAERIELTTSYIVSPELAALEQRVDQKLRNQRAIASDTRLPTQPATASIDEKAMLVPNEGFRFYPQMIRWTVKEIRRLVDEEGVPPSEIAVLAPFVSDALRFSLQTGLTEVGISSSTHRPSRALEIEPAAQTLLMLAKMAHPHWGMRPAPADVTLGLTLAIQGLDPVRAHLLSRIVYPERRPTIEFGRFGELVTDMQQRITYTIGEAYDHLRDWLYAYRANPEPVPLDQFFARLFGELLSQAGYGFHDDRDAARVASQLVESARNFRWAMESTNAKKQTVAYTLLGREYTKLVESGALGALYAPGWRLAEDAVFIAPAYTFLMRNRAVAFQFWLDIGAGGWSERLYQPLTHPYVLSQRWSGTEPWSDFAEQTKTNEVLHRLLLGLLRRTRRRIYLGISDYNENGSEQRGRLLVLFQRLLAEEALGNTQGAA